jgi:hypothetical protein
MWPLRQRLLLVAGWVVAAVATGVVSAGAVTVAGGQVTDRPLRPLSVAEVAALPVTIEDDCARIERLASGGSSSGECPDRDGGGVRSTASGDATDRSAAQPAEGEAPDASATSGLPDSVTDVTQIPPAALTPSPDDSLARSPVDVETPNTDRAFREPVVVDLVGGRVSVSVDAGALVLNFATPRPGYVAGLLFDRSDELTVTFWNGTELSTLVAGVSDGALDYRTSESIR